MTNSSSRLRIAVLFGGRSAEHDVSVLSATNAVRAMDPEKYDVIPVFITREGVWLLSHFEGGELTQPASGTEICPVPGGRGRLLAIPPEGAPFELPAISALFPVLHGLPGEDGAVQGLAEVALVPLIGCGVLGSATALDKDIAKRLLLQAGLPAARSITIRRGEAPKFAALSGELGLPLFIKPARQGSSVGVSKVTGEDDYLAALELGFRHDGKLLAEEFIKGREIECSVLEDAQGTLFVSRPGEIVTGQSHGFYSYEAKYIDEAGAQLVVPAVLPEAVEAAIRETAGKAFQALGCDAMARVDFFVTEDMRFLVNELNTIPGFTNISMYAKAMAASGIAYPDVIDRLIAHGLTRADRNG
ncbi:D-alanine--D-alanine ligase family protein [Nitratireductor indicus]|uniref:D-alanine--D-alanine ligase n=1 Tax=Nitratireductor indicus C115 TaxID=1231190 RepID=K2NV09_9HYPH|nr:D-alanine--D-alanine ligase family protein [Nitratireductor indicus]EKF41674.1 D-alanyl-alanine synthetase A [Nitratireductor indicus C115]MDS1137044.1 D-alanine--D-alanine ligase family protein [Nitratireductor indicus]SFQ68398.1 D-alanine-D-alanine ligase [Nitratireductor indicus]